jgi:hypothetical protein
MINRGGFKRLKLFCHAIPTWDIFSALIFYRTIHNVCALCFDEQMGEETAAYVY